MTTVLAKLQSDHEQNYNSSDDWHCALLVDARSVYTFTANASTNELTPSGTVDYLVCTKVQVSSTGVLPTPLAAATTYYVQSVSPLKLSETSGGSAIDLTTTGSGTHTITDVPLDETDSATAQWVRKEVVSYQGLTTRPIATPGSASINLTTKIVGLSFAATLNNSAGGAAVTFDKVLLIKNGSATPGNTTGVAADFYGFSLTQTVAAGESYTLDIPITTDNE